MGNHHRWAIVLAAGDGSRVAGLTRDRHGVAVPKQFCRPGSGPSLFARALSRARRVAPPERVTAIVARPHWPWWTAEVASLPPRNVVVQPANRGTAAGVLLPALAILERDPEAEILVLPSDHSVEREERLAAAAAVAFAAIGQDPGRLVLLGIEPESADAGYGWVLPGTGVNGGPRTVERFVEKPGVEQAAALRASGALWNSFLLAARGSTLLELARGRLPGTAAALETAWRQPWRRRPAALERAYETLPGEDFSRRLLEGAEDRLLVVPVEPCGWDDLGTPERVTRRVGRLVPPEPPAQDLPFAATAIPAGVPPARATWLSGAGLGSGLRYAARSLGPALAGRPAVRGTVP